MYARWQHAGVDEDAVYISWHTNGYNGDNDVVWGTVSYVHDGSTYPRTVGSLNLQNAVHTELIEDIRAGWEHDWVDLGQRARNLGEVRMLWDDDPANRMPGVLLEIGFHDNEHDANALKEPRFNQLAARAVYQGIVHYFEEKEGVDLTETPAPPTHLRVQNVGNGSGELRVAWSPSPTDTDGVRGDPATGYRVYTSTDGFAWGKPIAVTDLETTLTGFATGKTVYVRVTATNGGGESFPTETLGARVGDNVSLLIVNGFDKLNRFGLVEEIDPVEGYNLRMWLPQINGRAYAVHHGEAVPTAYAWDSASNEVISDTLVSLDAYPMIDWILGEESLDVDGTLNPAEQAALTEFVQDGGALLISGSELLWDLVDQGQGVEFASNVLHTGYALDDAGSYQVTPTTDGIFAELPTFYFDAPGEYDADAPDMLTALDGATIALNYADNPISAAAVQHADGCERTLVLGFPFEVIRPAARPDVMARALDFLDACITYPIAPPETGITSPVDGSYANVVPTFGGWASGDGLRRVEVQVLDANGAAWNGSAWLTPTTWLTATGTVSWTYGLPPLADGAYTLHAQAVATETDASPARAGFTLDTVAPLTPTIITPTGGITLAAGAVELRWSPPADTGAPLAYDLALDGITRTVILTRYTPTLNLGLHSWRVRAIDAAGNLGLWTPEAHFTIEGTQVYLPLIMRDYTVSDDPPVTACETVMQSGFESAENWIYGQRALRVQDLVHTGSWAARVGIPPDEPGDGSASYSSIAVSLTLPADAAEITLTYWDYAMAEDIDTGDYHYVGLRDAENSWHALYTGREDRWTWQAAEQDLSAFAGQTVTLYWGTKNDGDDSTAALFVDDVIVEACR